MARPSSSLVEENVARLDLGILASGTGTNLQAILDAIAEGTLDARVRKLEQALAARESGPAA